MPATIDTETREIDHGAVPSVCMAIPPVDVEIVLVSRLFQNRKANGPVYVGLGKSTSFTVVAEDIRVMQCHWRE